MSKLDQQTLPQTIAKILNDPEFLFWDIHTHLFPPQATELVRCGIDELLNYHYAYRQLIGFRRDITVEQFWKLPAEKRADLCWETYFAQPADSTVHALPVSEGFRAVSTILSGLGLDPNAPDLCEARSFFASVDLMEYHDRILKLAGISNVIGTNNPFDPVELSFYQSGQPWHPNFSAALRLDDLVLNPGGAFEFMREHFDLDVSQELSESTISATRKFCVEWMTGDQLPNVNYVGISFPPDFAWEDTNDPQTKVLELSLIHI